MNHTPDKVMAELDGQSRHSMAGPAAAGVRMLAAITEVRFNTLMVDLGGGATVEVAKPVKVCPALDQDVDGFTYDYSGDPNEGQSRTSTSGQDVETQAVVPKFIVGDVVEIGGVPGNYGDFAAALASMRLQVINSPAYWSEVSS